MAIALALAASSQRLLCDSEGVCCSVLGGTNAGWIRPSFDSRRSSDNSNTRCRNPLYGASQSHWLPTGYELQSSVRVSADDYSDSSPEAPKFMGYHGYHPLEELRKHERNIDMLLTDAETARTTVEANSKALLLFPGRVHCEPHGHISWADYRYVVNDYGDMFFEFSDDESILLNRHASNPVTVLIGMDSCICGENRMASRNYGDNLERDIIIDILFDDYYYEIFNEGVTDTLIKWGMPETMRYIHPMYFSRCLSKSVNRKYGEKMEFPSNGISMVGYLRPAFVDEESYLRNLHQEDEEGLLSDWKDDFEKEEDQVSATFDLIDGDRLKFGNRARICSTLYILEIMSIELFSIYGVQSTINPQDFQDAEPDLLARSASAIIERFDEYGMQCSAALKALCRKKKGLIVESANLIAVDSLGIDVRVSSGIEAQTLRFSFNARAMSESAAEKKIKRMLFPRYQRRRPRNPNGGVTDTIYAKEGGNTVRNEIVFISPTGEDIANERQLDQYLRAHPGGPASSEFADEPKQQQPTTTPKIIDLRSVRTTPNGQRNTRKPQIPTMPPTDEWGFGHDGFKTGSSGGVPVVSRPLVKGGSSDGKKAGTSQPVGWAGF